MSSDFSFTARELKLAGLVTAAFATGAVFGGSAVHYLHRYVFGQQQQQSSSSSSSSSSNTQASSTHDNHLRRKSSNAAVRAPSAANAAHAAANSLQDYPEAVVVVDPVSTGANVAHDFLERGIPCIQVMSGYVNPFLLTLIDSSIRTDFLARINHDSADPAKTLAQLEALPVRIVAVVAGSELGIELTDYLSEALGCPTNGTELSACRRDKYQMGEAVRRHGVRATKQARVQSWLEVEAFLESLGANPYPVVLKPIKSAGSDGVFKCKTLEEVRDKFEYLLGGKNQLGAINEAVVIQEFLQGIEYVVDTVSRNGKHKVVAIWEYDKRDHHGKSFIYFGMGSISGKSPVGKALATYVPKVLDAVGIKHGAGHAEVIMTPTGLSLVEVGGRCHGSEGTFMPLADRVWGYNQVGTLVSATISQTEFDAIPDVCGDEIEYGFKVDFVSYVAGKLTRIDHLDKMTALPSFVRFDVMPKVGDDIIITEDCFSAVGSVTLIHKNRKQVEEDHLKIREWEKTMFVVEKKQ